MSGLHPAGLAPRYNAAWLDSEQHPRRRFVGGVGPCDLWVLYASPNARRGVDPRYDPPPYVTSIRVCYAEGFAGFCYFWIDSRGLVNPDEVMNKTPPRVRALLPQIHNYLALFVPESGLVPMDEAEGQQHYGDKER